LLVVIGIIAVLIALLLGALARARDHANRVKCGANLHTIGIALVQYTQQFGYYPTCQLSSPNGDCALWPARLRLLMGGTKGVFYCPSRDDTFEWKGTSGPVSWRATAVEERYGYELGEYVIGQMFSNFSYGYNYRGAAQDYGSLATGTHRGLGFTVDLRGMGNPGYGEFRARFVQVPSEMIAIADSDANGHADYAIDASRTSFPPGAVHGRGANVLFCDGHVQWYAQDQITLDSAKSYTPERKAAVQRMWNNNHEPSPF
jgi:prepilin-type processing-associated H-X9-DG protein